VTAFRADLDALELLLARLRSFAGRADLLIADAESCVARLHGEWSGPAAAEHGAAHRQWADGAARMHAALCSLQSIVATARSNYAASSAANARMWS
jgi:uncharacterized protein YukE